LTKKKKKTKTHKSSRWVLDILQRILPNGYIPNAQVLLFRLLSQNAAFVSFVNQSTAFCFTSGQEKNLACLPLGAGRVPRE